MTNETERFQRIEDYIKYEAPFTKIVYTANGNALLIGGTVIELKCHDPEFFVDVISRALRRTSNETCSTNA